MRTACATAGSVASLLIIAACGSHTPQSAPAHPATTAAKAAATTPSCLTQFITWRAGGGLDDVHALAKALSKDGSAGSVAVASSLSPSSVSALGTAAARLQSAAQTAQSDAAPACVPGLRQDAGTAEGDYAQAAQSQLNAVSAMQDGNDQIAVSDLNAATAVANAGNRALNKAVADINAFSASR